MIAPNLTKDALMDYLAQFDSAAMRAGDFEPDRVRYFHEVLWPELAVACHSHKVELPAWLAPYDLDTAPEPVRRTLGIFRRHKRAP